MQFGFQKLHSPQLCRLVGLLAILHYTHSSKTQKGNSHTYKVVVIVIVSLFLVSNFVYQVLLWIGSDPLRTFLLLDWFGSKVSFTWAGFLCVAMLVVSAAKSMRWSSTPCLRKRRAALEPQTGRGWWNAITKQMRSKTNLWWHIDMMRWERIWDN